MLPFWECLLIAVLLFDVVHGQTTGEQNVCGSWNGLKRCCPGWTNGLNGHCIVAICNGNCGDRGECIAPNQCRCEDRMIRSDCVTSMDNEYMADAPANCPNNCNYHGECVSGKCQCEYGFTGKSCENKEDGPCFTHITRGLCQNPISAGNNHSTLMKRDLCCDSIGFAWGESCKTCGRPRCNKGFIMENHKCIDVDECRISGVCLGGSCINTEGSFECSCPYGYIYDVFTLQCKRIKDACELNKNACKPGGICRSQNDGTYKCECGSGYELDVDAQLCKRKQVALDYCELFKKQLCKNGECHPIHSSYECSCNPGYQPSRDKHQCFKEYNICALYVNRLCKNGQCKPFGRTYRCKCDTGYFLSREGTRCLDKCEQLGSRVCENGYCVTTLYGDYECKCRSGFEQTSDRKGCRISENRSSKYTYGMITNYQADQVQPQPYGKPLEAIAADGLYSNPCEQLSIKRKCNGGACLNLGSGNYECQCYPGYVAIQSKKSCVALRRPFQRRFRV